MTLPIELIPGTNPPRFKWQQTVSPLGGDARTVEHESMMQPSIEQAMLKMVALCKAQQQEIEKLKEINQGLADRIAAQSDILSRKAESQPAKKK